MKKTKTIIVIEGDDSLCMLLERMLGEHFVVESFKNGIEALAWLADVNKADLILADLMMSGIDGLDLLENVKTSGIFQDIPVIVLGDNDPDKENKCLAVGALSYIAKPFKPEALIDFIVHTVSNKNKLETQKTDSYVQHSNES